jgi:hypothetical protein
MAPRARALHLLVACLALASLAPAAAWVRWQRTLRRCRFCKVPHQMRAARCALTRARAASFQRAGCGPQCARDDRRGAPAAPPPPQVRRSRSDAPSLTQTCCAPPPGAQQRSSGPRRSLNWAPVAVPWLIAELAEPGLSWGDIVLLWTRFFSFEYRGFLMVVMGLTNQQILEEDLFADADDRARACGIVVCCNARHGAAQRSLRLHCCASRCRRCDAHPTVSDAGGVRARRSTRKRSSTSTPRRQTRRRGPGRRRRRRRSRSASRAACARRCPCSSGRPGIAAWRGHAGRP